MTNYWILPLWPTIHSPLSCGLLLARCQYLHRFNIVRVGHSMMLRTTICKNFTLTTFITRYACNSIPPCWIFIILQPLARSFLPQSILILRIEFLIPEPLTRLDNLHSVDSSKRIFVSSLLDDLDLRRLIIKKKI